MYFRRCLENETGSVIQIRSKYDQVLPHIRLPDILVFLGYSFYGFHHGAQAMESTTSPMVVVDMAAFLEFLRPR